MDFSIAAPVASPPSGILQDLTALGVDVTKNMQFGLSKAATANDVVWGYWTQDATTTTASTTPPPTPAPIQLTGNEPVLVPPGQATGTKILWTRQGGSTASLNILGSGITGTGGGNVILNLATLALGNFSAGGSIGLAPATVDQFSAFDIAQTTANQVLSLPTPSNAAVTKVVEVQNVGTAGFVMLGVSIQPQATAQFVWNATTWVAAAPPANVAPLVLANFAASGSLGSAASTVDQFFNVEVPQTTAGVALTIATPTVTTLVRTVRIINTGSVNFSVSNGPAMVPFGVSVLFVWDPTNATWTPATISDASAGPQPNLSLGNFAAGGSIGSAATTVDVARRINIGQTTTGQTLTISVPTAGNGEVVIANTGTAPFVMGGIVIPPATSVRFLFNTAGFWAPEQPQVQSSTASNAVLVANVAGGGSIGAANVTVDIATLIQVNQTTVNQNLTLNSPTQASQARLVAVANVGTVAFTMLGQVVAPGATLVAQWDAVNTLWRGLLNTPVLTYTFSAGTPRTTAFTPDYNTQNLVDASGGVVAATLPVITAGSKGALIGISTVTNTGSNASYSSANLTITAGAANTIDGIAAGQTITLSGKDSILLESDGVSNWKVIVQPSTPAFLTLAMPDQANNLQRLGRVTVIQSGGLTMNRTYSLVTTNAQAGDIIHLVIPKVHGAATLTINDDTGASLVAFANALANWAAFVFTGQHWILMGCGNSTI